MSENPSDYCPAPGNIWRVNTSNKVPTFFALREPFDITEDVPGSFWLTIGKLLKFPLAYNSTNLYMNAPAFRLEDFPLVSYQVNFKLALPFSVGRSQKTLYCTIQTETVDETGAIQDSEQGVFGAEEDSGGDTDPPINP